MKINEIKGFPKELLKGKTIPLYKAYFFADSEDEMKINTSIDLLSISKEAAVEQLVNELPMQDVVDGIYATTILNHVVSFAVIKLDKADLLTKDVIDDGDVFFENGVLSISLRDKLYKVDVEDNILESITIKIDDKTEKRICSDIKLAKA